MNIHWISNTDAASEQLIIPVSKPTDNDLSLLADILALPNSEHLKELKFSKGVYYNFYPNNRKVT
ncbi:MAG: hypothetical protein AAFO07_24205, partial [Bacteroidota bacterium]